MADSTAHVTIAVGINECRISKFSGDLPLDDINTACSFHNAALAREIYPEALLKAAIEKNEIPPIRLFNREELTFPLGLLQRVRTVLMEQGIGGELEMLHEAPTKKFDFVWQGDEPRDYQVAAITNTLQAGRNGMVVMPTGTGKTMVGALLIKELGLKTLWVVHSVDMVNQITKFMKQYLGLKVGQIRGGKFDLKTITVCSAASLAKAWKKLGIMEWFPELLIEDECHHAGAYKNFQALQRVDTCYYRYGMTATPDRTGGDRIVLEAAYGQVLYEIERANMEDQGWLLPVKLELIDIEKEHAISKGLNKWQDIYTAGITKHVVRNQRIADVVKRLVSEGRQVLVDVDEISHVQTLIPLLEGGIPVTGQESGKKRDKIYEAFRQGKFQVLFGTVLKEGLDLPTTGAIVLGGGKKSKIKVLQEIGRGLRPSGGMTECIIVDFMDQQHYQLFEHCQERFRTYERSGFDVPADAIRRVKNDATEDELLDDFDIEAIRKEQQGLIQRGGK